jgi:tetratricopeptide (TPR) repeat protein
VPDTPHLVRRWFGAARACATIASATIVVFFALCPAFGQDRKQLYDEGTGALYNLDFSTAEARFRKLTEVDPENPANWNLVASSLWLKIVAAQQKLNMESFSGSSVGTEASQNVVNATNEKQLRDTIATAISKADGRLKVNRRDVQAMYAKGVAKGTLATFEAVAKQSYISALSDAREARNLHADVLKEDPTFVDAKLTIGLYQYAVGSIPGWLRAFLGLWFTGGDKKSGVATVAEVARSGGAASTDAKMLLVVIYNREHQYDDSIQLLDQLHQRYPKNYLLELSEAAVRGRMSSWDQSLKIYQSVLDKIENRKDGYERLEAPKVLLLMARANIESRAADKALPVYERVVADRRSTDIDRGTAMLWMGKIYDSMGNRAKALKEYDSVLSLTTTPQIKQEAEKFKKQPFKS